MLLSDNYIYNFTLLTALLLMLFVIGRRKNAWKGDNIVAYIIKSVYLLTLISIVIHSIVFSTKALGLLDLFSLKNGVIFLVDLLIWLYVSYSFLRLTKSRVCTT